MTFPTPTPTPTAPAPGLAARQISIPNFTIPTSLDINLSITLPSSIGGITIPTSLPGITIQVNTPSTSSSPSPPSSTSSISTSSTSPSPSSSSSSSSSGGSKSRTPILAGIFTAVGLLALILLLLLLWYCRRRRRRRANDTDAFDASGYHEKPKRSAPSGGRTWWRPRGGDAVAVTPSLRSSVSVRTSSEALPATNESPMAFSPPNAATYAGVGAHGRHSSGDYGEYHHKEETVHTALLAPPLPVMTPSEGMLSPTSTFDHATSSALVSPDSLTHYAYGSYFPAHAGAGPGFSQGDPTRYALLGGGAGGADPFADNASGSSGTTTDLPNNAPYAHAFGLGPGDPDYLFVDHPGAGVYPWLAYSRRNTSTSGRTGSVVYQTGGSGPSTPGVMGAPQYPRVPFPRQWTDESGTTMYFTPTGEEIPRRMASQANYAEWFGHSSGAAAAGAAGAAPPVPITALPPPPPAARSASSSGSALPTIPERGDGLLPQPATDGVTPSSVRDEGDYTKARKLTVANE